MSKSICRVMAVSSLLASLGAMPALAAGAEDFEVAAKKMMIEETLVNCYKEKGDNVHAVDEFGKLIALKPNDARAHFDYANALLRLQRLPQAAVQFNKAAQLDKNVPEYLAGAGTAAMINKNYEAAVLNYTKAIQMGGKYQEQLQQAQLYHGQEVQLKKYQQYQQKLKAQQKSSGSGKGGSDDDDD